MLFVVQEHWSSHHHFDFRLELDGVLKSWAIPKDLPLEPGIKRLAVSVDDHDLSYAEFEGEITEGYGKGKVKIWDKGSYELIQRGERKIIFTLFGKKLKGTYVLLKFSPEPKNWLLFKER